MARRYSLTFQLFDVTLGEKAGDVLDDTIAEPVTVSPLGGYVEEWRRYVADAPVELLPPNIKAIRVAMARNGGAAIMRKRFDFEGKKYLVQMRVEAVAEEWKGPYKPDPDRAETAFLVLRLGPSGPSLYVDGEPVELKRAD